MGTLPAYVREVLNGLQQRGYAAYLVGGCVRDLCMGRVPHDWDIATAARPETVQTIFPRTIATGIRHGTVTVLMSNETVEVTTFRHDGGYKNHRHPTEIAYMSEVGDDLARRDFTMNAMAMMQDGTVIDPFGGQADIQRRLIRCVGTAAIRFEEDALRMLRALRFSAILGFGIADDTAAAIHTSAHLTAALSAERVRDELEKMLLSPRPALIADGINFGLFSAFFAKQQANQGRLARLAHLPNNRFYRWAGFAAILQTDGLIDNPATLMTALRLERKAIACVSLAAQLAQSDLPTDVSGIKHLLAAHGMDVVCLAAEIAVLLKQADIRQTLEVILQSGDCVSLAQLAISGADLIALGFAPGKQIGAILEQLLEHVLEYPADNKRERLLKLAQQ